MQRRRFLKTAAAAGSATLLARLNVPGASAAPAQPRLIPTPVRQPDEIPPARIAFVKTQDRAAGVTRALDLLGMDTLAEKHLFLKPNLNTSDPTPGSTHPDTLSALVTWLQASGADHITVGDRSYQGARSVMDRLGMFDMAEALGFETALLNDVPAQPENFEWVDLDDGHWAHGFLIYNDFLKADGIVMTHCLKTHQYGGHYTMALKNAVGMVPKSGPVGGGMVRLMDELHGSAYQRQMIAEINAAYEPDLLVMDGVEAFTHGGPMTGTRAPTDVILAGMDRVAMDAVGVAILRKFGTTDAVSAGRIFETDQIARAVALGLGVNGPGKIELVTDDPDSAVYAAEITELLLEQG